MPSELSGAEGVAELLADEARFAVRVAHVLEHWKGQGVDLIFDGGLFYRADNGERFNVGDVPPLAPEVGNAAVEELLRDGEPDVAEGEADLVPIWKTDPRDALLMVATIERVHRPRVATPLPMSRRRGTSRQARPGVRRRTRAAARSPGRPGDDPPEADLARRPSQWERAA